MKNRILTALLSALLLLVPLGTAWADPLWSEEYYRAGDTAGILTETQKTDLDQTCISFMKEWNTDLVLMGFPQESFDRNDWQELAEFNYYDCGFGWGENQDGIMLLVNTDTGEARYFTFGDAGNLVPEEFFSFAEKSASGYFEKYGVYGVMYAGARHLSLYLEEHGTPPGKHAPESAAVESAAADPLPAGSGTAEIDAAVQAESVPADAIAAETEVNKRVGEGSSLPAWYPADPGSFQPYHNEAAKRVVDTADIFTDAEEAELEACLLRIRRELDRDLVICTDVSSYGLDQSIYAADFFDYNGYGCGDEYEGACLFICMDPEDRGWWVACTGSETMDLYTEDFANEMDDRLYEFMVEGRYAEGVTDWAENFRNLYRTGMPFPPAWYPEGGKPGPRRNDSASPRVDDSYGLFTENEAAALREKAAAISADYGIDVVIHTARSSGSLTPEEYAELYYECGGYGLGPDYDGILLTLFSPYYDQPTVYASGTALEKLNDRNLGRILIFVQDKAKEGKHYQAADGFLDRVRHMEKTGRVPRSPVYWALMSVLSLIAGSIFGGFSLAGARKRMAVPQLQENADQYMVGGPAQVQELANRLIGTSTSRKYIPPVTKSSGGGSSSSSHRSSYSRSYSGSSGRSHSGSGRKF